MTRRRERHDTNFADRDPVREDADAVQSDTPSGSQGSIQRIEFVRLDPHDAHLGRQRLDVASNAGDEAAAADRHEHRVHSAGTLSDDLVTDCPLTGDDQWVIERVDTRQTDRRDELLTLRFRSLIVITVKLHLGTQPATTSSLIAGVVRSMTMPARIPRRRAA